MKVSGFETCNMAKAVKNGQIRVQYLQEIFMKDFEMDMEFGYMKVKDMKGIGSII